MISRRILSNYWFKSSLQCDPFVASPFNFGSISYQIRQFYGVPRFDFGRIRKPDDAVALFREMQLTQPLPSVFDFNKLLTSVVKIKQYKAAVLLFDEMLHRDVPVDLYTFNIAMNCFRHLRRPDYGFAVLGCILKRGYQPDVVTFNSLIDGLLLEGNISDARNLLVKIYRENLCEPDEVTYLVVINGLCKAGLTLAALDQLKLFEKQRCQPNIYVYSAVIDGLCKDRMIDDALRIFSSLVDKGISPDVVTYNSMIQGLCNSSRWREVQELSNEMVAREVHPNVHTFNILVDGYSKEGWVEEAEQIIERMKQEDIQPDIYTYNSLMDGYCMRGEMEKARKVFDLAVNSGLKHDIISYNILMNGYCKRGHMDEVLHLFNEIPTKGLERDVVSYSTMLQALFREGRCDEGLKLFREMRAPNIRTYNILMHGLCGAHRIDEAFFFLNVMENEGHTPDILTYNILIEGLCSDEKLGRAKDLFIELGSKGLQPNVVTFNIIIGALCKEGNLEEAMDLAMQMENYLQNNDCLPNSGIYSTLVRGYAKWNKIGDAIPVLDEMERRGLILHPGALKMLMEHLQEQGKDSILFAKVNKLVPKKLV